jgi:hypothetical protein
LIAHSAKWNEGNASNQTSSAGIATGYHCRRASACVI